MAVEDWRDLITHIEYSETREYSYEALDFLFLIRTNDYQQLIKSLSSSVIELYKASAECKSTQDKASGSSGCHHFHSSKHDLKHVFGMPSLILIATLSSHGVRM